MSQIIKLKNEELTAKISTLGAEITSLNDSKEEYIWQADKNIWARSAPVLFPICGGLKNNTYTYNGKAYTMNQHGFAKDTDFEIKNQTENSVCMFIKSNDETIKNYPFEFELYVTFELIKKSLNIKYTVINNGENCMYFSIGGHEGYSCPEGAESYTLAFDNDTILKRHMINSGILTGKTEDVILKDKTMILDYNEFARGTYLFDSLNSKSVVLSNKEKTRNIKVSFDGFSQLALWTLPERKYLCIEPWCGFSQSEHFNGDITKKFAINTLEKGKIFERTHTIEVF